MPSTSRSPWTSPPRCCRPCRAAPAADPVPGSAATGSDRENAAIMAVTLGSLAVRYGCALRGDPERRVERVGTLRDADAGAVSFLANPAYRAQLAATSAGAVILAERDA